MILNVSEAGDGPPLVLLHGLFGAARNLGALTRALSSQLRVYAMDLRNHGESPHGSPMDYATMAGDVAETMRHLGLAHARVCGHSMGGKVAMTLALAHPELVERLVVMDIAPVTYDHEYDGFVRAMATIPLTPSLTRGEADQALAARVKQAPMRAFLLNNLVLGETPYWRLGLAEIQASMPSIVRWDDPPGWQPYKGKALFLRGAESGYVGPETIEPIEQRFPNARLRAIEGAAHWLHADKPQEVIAALQEFLAP